MDAKEIQIDCPCCRSRLAVDVRTARVVRWAREEEVDPSGKPKVRGEDWDTAHGRVQTRLESAEERFEAGLGRERTREQDLDELFRRKRDEAEGPAEEE